jgi:hypothetical protein
MEEAATPFPSEETTPPVTKIYFGAIRDGPRTESRTYPPSAGDVQGIMDAGRKSVKREDMGEWNEVMGSFDLCVELLQLRGGSSDVRHEKLSCAGLRIATGGW